MSRYIAEVELGKIRVCLVRVGNEIDIEVTPNIPELGEGNYEVIGFATINCSMMKSINELRTREDLITFNGMLRAKKETWVEII